MIASAFSLLLFTIIFAAAFWVLITFSMESSNFRSREENWSSVFLIRRNIAFSVLKIYSNRSSISLRSLSFCFSRRKSVTAIPAIVNTENTVSNTIALGFTAVTNKSARRKKTVARIETKLHIGAGFFFSILIPPSMYLSGTILSHSFALENKFSFFW